MRALFPAAISAFAVTVVAASLLLDGHERRIMLFPVCIAIAIVALSCATILRASAEENRPEDVLDWREPVRLLSVVPLVFVFGVMPGSGLYLAAYMIYHGSRPVTSVLAGAALCAGFYAIFTWMLNARLYTGLLAWV